MHIWLQEATESYLSQKKPKLNLSLEEGPGSSKGTQCANILEYFGYTHLSWRPSSKIYKILVRKQVKTMIQNMINEEKIVPLEVTIKLLEKTILENGIGKFLIDGSPRNEETVHPSS
ncbi:hypothetical protein LXL04_008384 [Taraxacum kok-saghyz]